MCLHDGLRTYCIHAVESLSAIGSHKNVGLTV